MWEEKKGRSVSKFKPAVGYQNKSQSGLDNEDEPQRT
jgi:hypothetical protein